MNDNKTTYDIIFDRINELSGIKQNLSSEFVKKIGNDIVSKTPFIQYDSLVDRLINQGKQTLHIDFPEGYQYSFLISGNGGNDSCEWEFNTVENSKFNGGMLDLFIPSGDVYLSADIEDHDVHLKKLTLDDTDFTDSKSTTFNIESR